MLGNAHRHNVRMPGMAHQLRTGQRQWDNRNSRDCKHLLTLQGESHDHIGSGDGAARRESAVQREEQIVLLTKDH